MSFRPPRFLNLGVGRPRLGPRGRTNELSQLLTSTRPTTQPCSLTNSRFSTSTSASAPLSHGGPRPRSHQYQHHHQKQDNQSSHSWQQQQQQQHQQTRHNSSNSSSNSQSNPNPNQQANARIDRLISRLPRFLHPYLSSLRSSPSSFVVAFLILHEITAVVPGLGFFYFFHYYDTGSDEEEGGDEDDGDKRRGGKEGRKASSYGKKVTDWVMGWMMEHGYSEVMMNKMEGFERWFRRKGYFGFGKEDLSAVADGGGLAVGEEGKKGESEGAGGGEGGEEERKEQALMRKWQSGDEKYRVLVDAALAYAITKALLPVRIIVSVQATPWFAGVLGRVRRVFGSGLRK